MLTLPASVRIHLCTRQAHVADEAELEFPLPRTPAATRSSAGVPERTTLRSWRSRGTGAVPATAAPVVRARQSASHIPGGSRGSFRGHTS
jgi:hypothetical protein